MPKLTTRQITAAMAAAAGLLAPALAPAQAAADVFTFGSTLAAPADQAEARQADTAFWHSAFPDSRSTVAPADGQIRLVKIKGIALSDKVTGEGPPGGERDFHVQVMQPLADGRFQIRNPGGTSGNMQLPPRTFDPQAVTDYVPENLCARKGDVIVFNTVGGWDGIVTQTGPYPGGTPLQIFSNVPGAVTSHFEKADATNNGDIVSGTPTPNRELLMQMILGTGGHATGLCPGGTAGPEGPLALGAAAPPPGSTPPQTPVAAQNVQKATLPARQRVTVSKKGKLSVSLFCRLTTSRCTGKVRVLRRTGKAISLGAAQFDVAGKKTGHARIFLNRTGRRLFFKKGKGRLGVKIVAVTSPGGPSRTSSLKTTLRKRGG